VNRDFCLWSCQLWLYLLLLSCEIGRVLWLFSYSTVRRVYRFLDIVLMDSDHYRYIFQSTTIVFEITRISVSYSFPTISYRFRFREKKYENESDFASYRSFPTVFIPSEIRDPQLGIIGSNRRCSSVMETRSPDLHRN
jgi:hypothetical protein